MPTLRNTRLFKSDDTCLVIGLLVGLITFVGITAIIWTIMDALFEKHPVLVGKLGMIGFDVIGVIIAGTLGFIVAEYIEKYLRQ